MPKATVVYRVLVACGAWAVVGFVTVAAVRAAVPAVGHFLDDPALLSPGHITLVAIMALFLLLVLVGWIGTLLHVATNAAFRSPAQRVIIIAFLLLVNVGASFIYYFVYLVWVRKGSSVASDAAAAV
jgi:hypothetical protein